MLVERGWADAKLAAECLSRSALRVPHREQLAERVALGRGLVAKVETGGVVFRDNAGAMASSMFLFADPGNRLNLGTGNTTRMTITPQGSIGIGTMNPAARPCRSGS